MVRATWTKITISAQTSHEGIEHSKVKEYTANFYPMKTMGTGYIGVRAGKTCTIYGKGLCRLRGNPIINIDPNYSSNNYHGVSQDKYRS